MKILRFYCPFGGKPWPSVILTFICVAAVLCADAASLQSPLFLLVLLILCIGGLCVLYWLEHRIKPDEEPLIEQADYAIFAPVTPEVIRRVSNIEPNDRSLWGVLIMFICLLPIYSSLLLAEELEEDAYCAVLRLIAGLMIAVACFFMLHFLYPIFAKKLSKDATYTVIPIYRHYTVRNRSRRRGWDQAGPSFSHYVVFYLPDGRYTLPVKREEAHAENIIIVKSNGFYLWYTDAADNPDSIRRTMLFRS
jgi:hypothetical protein